MYRDEVEYKGRTLIHDMECPLESTGRGVGNGHWVDFSLAFTWGDGGISLPRSVGGPHDDGKVYG